MRTIDAEASVQARFAGWWAILLTDSLACGRPIQCVKWAFRTRGAAEKFAAGRGYREAGFRASVHPAEELGAEYLLGMTRADGRVACR